MTEANKSSNTVWHEHTITRDERAQLKKHKSCLVWFTGLSGSGKSTLANALEDRLYQMGFHTYVLDGDNVRHGLNGDLGFSDADRTENIRRIAEVGKLMVDAGILVMTAFISPFKEDRQKARDLLADGDFVEVYACAELDVCEERDPKGLYKKARAGEIPEFTGISSPYEAPEAAEIVVHTDQKDVPQSVDQIVEYLQQKGYIS